MNEPAPETVLDQAAMDRVRVDVRSVISGERITQRVAADEANIAPATFNAWLNSSYAGNNEKVTLTVADGVGHAKKGDRGDLRIDVRGLTALYTGFLSAEALKTAGRIEGSDEVLRTGSAIFAGPTPAMADMF